MRLTTITQAIRLDRKRTDAYLAQTGRKFLTPRQRRRIEHKGNHAMAPFGVSGRPVR